MTDASPSSEKRHYFGSVDRAIGRAALATGKFVLRSSMATTTLVSPLIGIGTAFYIAKKTGSDAQQTSDYITSGLCAGPVVSALVNYGMARAEIFVRTTRLFRNRDLSYENLRDLRTGAEKANKFNTNCMLGAIGCSSAFAGVFMGIAMARPFGIGGAFLFGLSVAIGLGATVTINLERPMENHFNQITEKNLKRFEDRRTLPNRLAAHRFG